MAYELWNADTANLIGAYDTEEEALEAVREILGDSGAEDTESLVLGYEDHRGHSRTIAIGATLVERAVAMTVGVGQTIGSPAGPQT